MSAPRPCLRCGTPFQGRSVAQQYCSAECRKAAEQERDRERRAKKREDRPAPPPVKRRRFMGCQKCKYGLWVYSGWACDYLSITGHRRPCPSLYAAGSCDCYEPKGRSRAKSWALK